MPSLLPRLRRRRTPAPSEVFIALMMRSSLRGAVLAMVLLSCALVAQKQDCSPRRSPLPERLLNLASEVRYGPVLIVSLMEDLPLLLAALQ